MIYYIKLKTGKIYQIDERNYIKMFENPNPNDNLRFVEMGTREGIVKTNLIPIRNIQEFYTIETQGDK